VSGALFLKDLARARACFGKGGLRAALECLGSPGVQAVAVYRFGSWCARQPALARIVLEPPRMILDMLIKVLWGIEISRRAKIGPGLYVGHFGGITVSPHAVIGANCSLSQSVTIGIAGEGQQRGAPVIGNDVYIGPGARLFGLIRIGNNVKIGANAVIHRDIPDDAVVALDPGFRIISYRGNRRGKLWVIASPGSERAKPRRRAAA
jgi:serine O-acetyltransferase